MISHSPLKERKAFSLGFNVKNRDWRTLGQNRCGENPGNVVNSKREIPLLILHSDHGSGDLLDLSSGNFLFINRVANIKHEYAVICSSVQENNYLPLI